MSDTDFDSFEEMMTQIQREINVIVRRDVAPVVEKILKQHIKDDIYGVYTPKQGAWVNGSTYERRNQLAEKVVSLFPTEDELVVTSTEDANTAVIPGYAFSNIYEGSFLELLESGHMGIWRNGFARPAVENAQMDVDTSPAIDKAVEKGLRRHFGKFEIV